METNIFFFALNASVNHGSTELIFITFATMARIMAIDYGSKRVGIAVTDPLQIIATGLTTVHSKDLLEFLNKYISKEEVECIVVGEPKRMNNEPSESARFIEPFVVHLKRSFPDIKVERMDERFTSKMAFQTMIDSGLKKMARQNKELVDEISATIILQSYLEKKKNNF
jgi:putative Holliday junction resolvase